jgi:hypothetical protein
MDMPGDEVFDMRPDLPMIRRAWMNELVEFICARMKLKSLAFDSLQDQINR